MEPRVLDVMCTAVRKAADRRRVTVTWAGVAGRASGEGTIVQNADGVDGATFVPRAETPPGRGRRLTMRRIAVAAVRGAWTVNNGGGRSHDEYVE